MRHLLTLCLLACCVAPGQALDWPRDLNGVPAANATDIATIKALINSVLGPNSDLVAVGEFRFLPLEAVNRIDLIASAAISGRGRLNAFIAIWQSPEGGYGHAILPTDGRSSVLPSDVVDLDGTGVHEVIAGTIPGPYLGADTIAIPWYRVYRLKQGKWVDVSDKYPKAQSDMVPVLVRVMADACSSGDKALVERFRDYALFVYYKDVRLRGTASGLTAALEWAGSPDRVIRWLAVEMLAETPDPRAISALGKLAGDPDPGVSAFAESVLTHMGVGAERK
jgi:hypothetical protein